MFEFNPKVRWGVIFQAEDLDETSIRDYFNSDPKTTVQDVIRDTYDIENSETKEIEKVECVLFIMETAGIIVPPKFRFELNLRSIENEPYIFQPVER